ncbi:hypothetical protein KC669_05145, partial [Candidatus Dojkabacteria bacterium]|nr:hypothetical protein [Candidatus Dojkabacteria bacterium]
MDMDFQNEWENNTEHFYLRGELMRLAGIIEEKVPFDRVIDGTLPKSLVKINLEVGDFRYPSILVTKPEGFIVSRLAYLHKVCVDELNKSGSLDEVHGEDSVKDTINLIKDFTSKI